MKLTQPANIFPVVHCVLRVLCLCFIDHDTLFNSLEIDVKVGQRHEASVPELTVKSDITVCG